MTAPATGWEPPPVGARPRRRRRWPWVLGGVLAAIAGLAIAGAVLFTVKVKPPIDAVNAFLTDVRDGDYEGARDRLCTEDRRVLSSEGLRSLFRPGVEDFDVNPFDVSVDGDRATVSFDREDERGDDDYYELDLRKEGGDWRVCLSEALEELRDD